MAEVKCVALTKSFGKGAVVSDFTLTIPHGNFVTLLGPSGCGKTTTLNLIAGLEELDKGHVVVDGVDVTSLPPNKRDMAMVFQSYALYPHMSVFDNIGFGLQLAGMKRHEIKQQVQTVAEVLGITPLLQRFPKELSGGERQRVALGRALSRHPKVFLMDEPLSNLDAKLRVRMRFEIKRLHLEQGSTTIYVTHDQLEAMTMSDLIAIMDGGVLQQFGPPREIYDRPVNLFVAGFTGSPPMNLLRGEWHLAGDCTFFRCNGGELRLPPGLGEELKARQTPASIMVGVRPEDIEVVGPSETPTASCEVLVVEQIGADDYLHVAFGRSNLVIRVPAAQTRRRGEQVMFRLEPSKVHLFDVETSQRIALGFEG